MRRISIGRRNWLFTGSETGGQNLAILFSFAATCKANAINYRQWLEDVLVRIIRKNCLFAGSEAGGQRLAILYSFAATCKANGICFRKWLEDVLPRLNSTPAEQIDSLIPKGEAK